MHTTEHTNTEQDWGFIPEGSLADEHFFTITYTDLDLDAAADIDFADCEVTA